MGISDEQYKQICEILVTISFCFSLVRGFYPVKCRCQNLLGNKCNLLKEYQDKQTIIDSMISAAMDTAAMSLAVIFAQTTGVGCGCWDWAGNGLFREAVNNFVAERTSPDWPGLKPGDKCHPETYWELVQ